MNDKMLDLNKEEYERHLLFMKQLNDGEGPYWESSEEDRDYEKFSKTGLISSFNYDVLNWETSDCLDIAEDDLDPGNVFHFDNWVLFFDKVKLEFGLLICAESNCSASYQKNLQKVFKKSCR